MPPRVLSEQEYNALRDQVLAKLPDGLTEEEYKRTVGPLMEQALGIAENTTAPLQGSSMARALSGLWNALPSPKAVYQSLPIPEALGGKGIVQGPLDALSGMANAQADQAIKAYDAKTPLEMVGHGAAALMPVIGPMAATIGEHVAQTGDIAGGVGGAIGLAGPAVALAGMKANRAAQAKAGVPDLLERQAVDQVAQKVLAPGNVAFRGRAQTAAQGVLDRGMTGSRDALRESADVGMQDAGTRIDTAIDAAGGPKAGVAINPIVAQLQRKIDDLSIGGRPIKGAEDRVAGLKARIQQLEQTATTQPAATVQPPNAPIQVQPFETLRRYRDENYRLANDAKAYQRAGQPALSDEGFAAAETGSAIRSHFGNLAPDLASANADYTFFKTLGDVLDPAQGRPKVTTPTKGVTGGAATVGAVVGNMVGPKATFVLAVVKPWIEEVRSRPEWQLADAQDKIRLAQAIRAGNIGRAKGLMAKIAAVSPRGELTSPSESQNQTTAPGP